MKFDESIGGGKTSHNGSSLEEENSISLRRLHDDFQDKITDAGWNVNSPSLFMKRQTLSRVLYMNDLYKMIVGKTGIICEFGVRFGPTMSLMTNFRGIYEPYNYLRRVVGFDTFEGFTEDLNEEERKVGWEKGDHSVQPGYENFLSEVLTLHEQNAPINHKQKFELVKGDVCQTFEPWLEANPEAVIALAIFDMDVYHPTKFVLERILERMPKGGILAFDEINLPSFPGETQALRETLEIRNLRLRTNPNNPAQAWCELE